MHSELPPAWTPAPAPAHNRTAILAAAVLGVVLVLLLAILVTGGKHPGSNGESSKSGSQMLIDSAAALAGARSFHLTGSGTSGAGTATYDLRITPTSTEGTVTASGARADVVVLGNDVYLRGREFFSRFAGAAAAAAIGDRWVHVHADDPSLSKGLEVLTFSGITRALAQVAGQSGGVEKGDTVHDHGVLAMPLRGADGSLDVALDGRPYPTRLHFDDPGSSGDLSFSDFDQAVSPPQRPTDALEPPST
jgi:hypothetical protein